MTLISVDEQVEILKTTTERVGVSREAASEFLRSAGIYTVADGSVRGETSHIRTKKSGTHHLQVKAASVSKTNKK